MEILSQRAVKPKQPTNQIQEKGIDEKWHWPSSINILHALILLKGIGYSLGEDNPCMEMIISLHNEGFSQKKEFASNKLC